VASYLFGTLCVMVALTGAGASFADEARSQLPKYSLAALNRTTEANKNYTPKPGIQIAQTCPAGYYPYTCDHRNWYCCPNGQICGRCGD
jgi:hypothetical protein